VVTYELRANGHGEAAAIRRLLELADEEFVPPLSARSGTDQRDGLDDSAGDSLDAYLDAALDHTYILARVEGEVAGVLSFHDGYEIPELEGYLPSNYVSTVIVHPDHRRNGYARGLWNRMLQDLPESRREPFVTTRTWSTNDSHVELLAELGFEEVTRIPDDRGPGIDTVYFGLALSAEEGSGGSQATARSNQRL
jgi:ribosomal protein S18 acetylase RimI-like enzyme